MKASSQKLQPIYWLAILLFVGVIPLCMIINWHYQIPFGDSWDDNIVMYLDYLNHNLSWNDLFHHHNEHRLLLTRLLYFANYAIAPNATSFMQLISYGLFLGCFITLCHRYAYLHKTQKYTQSLAGTYCLFALMVFPAANVEIWRWDFITQFPLTLFFFLLTVFAIKPRLTWLQLIVVTALSWLTTYSSANGLIVWPLSLLLMLSYRTDYRKIILFGIVAAGVIITYTQGNHTEGITLNQPIQSLLYLFAFLGNPFGFQLPHAIPVVAGAIALSLFTALTYRSFKYVTKDTMQALYPWIIIGLFTLGNAFIASLTRVQLNIGQSLSTRYVCITGLMYVSIVVLTQHHWHSIRTPIKRALQLLLTAFVLLTLVEFAKIIHTYALYSHLNPQEIALPYKIFLPQEKGVYPPGNQLIASRLANYATSPIYTPRAPQPNYLNKQLSSAWIKQHGQQITAIKGLRINVPTDYHAAGLTNGIAVQGSINKPPFDTLSNSLLLLNSQYKVVGIAFATTSFLPWSTQSTVPIYGFLLNHSSLDSVLWLNQPYGIQQNISKFI